MTDHVAHSESRQYVFAGGGSGGHLTPSLAVAEAILEHDPAARLLFLTSGRDIDRVVLQHAKLSRHAQYEVVPLKVTQPPSLSWSGVRHLRLLFESVLRCRSALRQRPATVMLATGAFASVPGLLAARRLRIPTVLFEANTVPGRVNRWWAPHASLTLSGLPTEPGVEPKFEYIGMPVRRAGSNPCPRMADSRQILVVGGSQGSRRLSELVRQVFSKLTLPPGWNVVLQTGAQADTAVNDLPVLKTIPFIDDMITEMRRSAFVVSRAGAVTIGELAATGSPSILVPLESASENHQLRNAEQCARQGAAKFVKESGPLAVENLAAAITKMVTDDSGRCAMSQAADELHRADAADQVARRLIELAG